MSIIGSNALAGAAGQAGGAAGFQISRSVRLNSADSAYFSRTPSSAGNRKTWTWSGWIKKTADAGSPDDALFTAGTAGATQNRFIIKFSTGDQSLEIGQDVGGSFTLFRKTSQVFRDYSSWGHLVVAFDSTNSTANDRLKIYWNGSQITQFATNNTITQNLDTFVNNTGAHYICDDVGNYHGNLDTYLAEVNFIDGVSGLAATDFGEYDSNSVWQPKDTSGLTFGTNGFRLTFSDNSSNAALGTDSSGAGNNWSVNNLVAAGSDYTGDSVLTGTIYPGAGAISNLFDGTDTGVAPSEGSYITFTPSTAIPITSSLRVKANVSNASEDATFAINGTDTSTVTVGFPASGGIGNSSSTWTTISSPPSSLTSLKFGWASGGSWMSVSGIEVDGVVLRDVASSSIDSLIDTPTNYSVDSGNPGGNYATLNRLDASGNADNFPNGNLDFTKGSSYGTVKSTIGMASGKWYCEVNPGSGSTVLGVLDATIPQAHIDQGSGGYGYRSDGQKYNSGTHGDIGSYSSSDIIGLAFDADAKNIYFYKNGNLQGSFTNITPAVAGSAFFFAFSASSTTLSVNFGQRPFKHPVSGYKSLCTTNFDPPTIADGSQYFDTKLYAGATQSPRTIDGLSFTPSFVWVKNRSATSGHLLWDAVRGVDKNLRTDGTYDEAAVSASANGIISNSATNGFIVKNGSNSGSNVGSSGSNAYVAWAWDGGTSTVSNTDGSITSSVRANPSAGFSIVSYTGNGSTNQTVGHGLNAKPSLVIYKDRDSTSAWRVIPTFINDGHYLALNSTDAIYSAATSYFGTNTSSVLGISGSNSGIINANGNNIIAYCFTSVDQYSSFGKYIGNGALEGPFVFTSMRPKVVIIKRTDAASSWRIFDTERSSYNVVSNLLQLSSSAAEATGTYIDILSNGFKIRTENVNYNASGGSFIYLAFAENPFSLNGGLAR